MADGLGIGRVAAELMDQVEAEFGDDAQVTDAIVVVEITAPGEEPDDRVSRVLWRQTGDRQAVAAGLLSIAHDLALREDEPGG